MGLAEFVNFLYAHILLFTFNSIQLKIFNLSLPHYTLSFIMSETYGAPRFSFVIIFFNSRNLSTLVFQKSNLYIFFLFRFLFFLVVV